MVRTLLSACDPAMAMSPRMAFLRHYRGGVGSRHWEKPEGPGVQEPGREL